MRWCGPVFKREEMMTMVVTQRFRFGSVPAGTTGSGSIMKMSIGIITTITTVVTTIIMVAADITMAAVDIIMAVVTTRSSVLDPRGIWEAQGFLSVGSRPSYREASVCRI